jgi:hypothetical protein
VVVAVQLPLVEMERQVFLETVVLDLQAVFLVRL